MSVRFSQLEEYLNGLVAPALQNAIADSRERERKRMVGQIVDLAVRGDAGAAEVAKALAALDAELWGVEQVHVDPGNQDSRAVMEFFVRDPHLRGRIRVRVLYDAQEESAG